MFDLSQSDDEIVQQNVIDTPTDAEIAAKAGITGMINSVRPNKTARNHFRNVDQNSSDLSPNSNAAKQHRLNKIDPILIKTNDSSIFDRSDYITFDNHIIEASAAEIRFTKLDKYNNLLIFPKSFEDVDLLMNCKDLFPDHQKIDLNKQDRRPKLVIKGLSYQMARRHFHTLNEEGIEELINLTKEGNKPVNIVKVIMINEQAACDLLDKSYIKILHLDFAIVADKPKKKLVNSDFNPVNLFATSSNEMANNTATLRSTNNIETSRTVVPLPTSSPTLKDIDEIVNKSLNNFLILFKDSLDDKFNAKTKELKNEIKQSETRTVNLIKSNNANLATAFNQIISQLCSNKSLNEQQTLEIINKCCPVESVQVNTDSDGEEFNM